MANWDGVRSICVRTKQTMDAGKTMNLNVCMCVSGYEDGETAVKEYDTMASNDKNERMPLRAPLFSIVKRGSCKCVCVYFWCYLGRCWVATDTSDNWLNGSETKWNEWMVLTVLSLCPLIGLSNWLLMYCRHVSHSTVPHSANRHSTEHQQTNAPTGEETHPTIIEQGELDTEINWYCQWCSWLRQANAIWSHWWNRSRWQH